MKFEMQKGFGLVGIIIALAVVIFAGGGGLYWKEAQNQKSVLQSGNDAIKQAEELKAKIEQQNKLIANELVADTSNWKTYRNEKYGFEVKYPIEVIFSEKELNGFLTLTFKDWDFKDLRNPILFFSVEERSRYATITEYKILIEEQFSECKKSQIAQYCREPQFYDFMVAGVDALRIEEGLLEVYFIKDGRFFRITGKTLQSGFGQQELIKFLKFL